MGVSENRISGDDRMDLGFPCKCSDKTKSLVINPSLSTDATPDDAKMSFTRSGNLSLFLNGPSWGIRGLSMAGKSGKTHLLRVVCL